MSKALVGSLSHQQPWSLRQSCLEELHYHWCDSHCGELRSCKRCCLNLQLIIFCCDFLSPLVAACQKSSGSNYFRVPHQASNHYSKIDLRGRSQDLHLFLRHPRGAYSSAQLQSASANACGRSSLHLRVAGQFLALVGRKSRLSLVDHAGGRPWASDLAPVYCCTSPFCAGRLFHRHSSQRRS